MYKEQEFERIVEQFGPMLHGIANKFRIKGYTHEDLMQEIYTKIWESMDNFDRSRGRLSTFIYTLSYNYIQNLMRDVNRGTDYILHLDKETPNGDSTFKDAILTDDVLDIETFFDNLVLPLRLNGYDKNVLKLRYIDEMSYREIAEIVGCSHTSISTIIKKHENTLKDLTRKI